ncbi:MAG TPA: hypothetical protein VIM55_20000 [Mucilaginibacter sp.]
MKKIGLKLGSIKEMLTNEEMKRISGGYAVCCCVGGSGGGAECNHSWSGGIGQTNCASWCAQYGATGGQWDANSLCNHWGDPCGS